MSKPGHFEKGRWIQEAPSSEDATITVNLNVEGLENIQKVKEALIELDMVKRGVMTLDDTFTQQGFDEPKREIKPGIVNRIKNAGKIIWKSATCPFRKEP